MEDEQPTPTRKVIPPISLVAIICLAVGLGIGYVYGKNAADSWEFDKDSTMAKFNKRSGEVWIWMKDQGKWVELKDKSN